MSMRVAIIGASGKTGRNLVREALKRGHEVVAVCRNSSAGKLGEFADREGFVAMTAAVVGPAPPRGWGRARAWRHGPSS